MRKFFKILGVVLVIIIGAVLAIPTLFSDEVENFAKDMAGEYVDADVDFDDFSLSIIKSFPYAQAGIDGITIMGKDKFQGDTLLHVGTLRANLDVLSALKGDIKIRGVRLDDVLINGIVASDSSANWDIVKPLATDSTEAETDTTASAPLKLSLKKVELTNCRIAFCDSTSNLFAKVDGLGVNMSGTMHGNVMDAKLKVLTEAINVKMGNIAYLKDSQMDFDALINADLDSMKFTFKENKLNFAGIPLEFDGWVQQNESSIGLDMQLATKETTFKTILDLVPEDILKSVEGLQTTGSLQMYAKAKGTFVDEEHLPAFDALFRIKDGHVQYPDLPKSLDNVNVAAKVKNVGGPADNTRLSIDTMHFSLGSNPFDVTAHVRTPVSNPVFDAKAKGTIDLGSLKDALPLEDMNISGLVKADISVAGDLKSINDEKYEKVNANGTVEMNNFTFVSKDLPKAIDITNATLKFSPKSLKLNPLEIKVGKSDFSMTGDVENYLQYVLSDGTLKGIATLNSKYVDCNELMAMSGSEETTTDNQTQNSSSAIELPTNIDFTFTPSISKLVFDALEVNNITGKVTLIGGVANLSNLSMKSCGGTMTLNGSLETPKRKDAHANMKVNMDNVDLNKLTSSFSTVKELLPIAQSAYGTVSVGLDVVTDIDKELSPIMKSVNGSGTFNAKQLELKESDFQNKLASLLKNDKYKDINLKSCNIKYKITDGNVLVEPFEFNMLNKTATFSGRQGLDQTMDYKLSLPVARKDALSLVSSLGVSLNSKLSEGADLPIGIKIGGELTKPQVSLDLAEVTTMLKNEAKGIAKEKATDAAKKAANELNKKLEGNEKAQKAVDNVKKGLNKLFKK